MLKRFTPKLKSDTLAQSVVVAMILAIVCRILAFGRGVVLVRVLEPADLGTWALMSNAVQVLAFFVALGIPSGISRYAERHRLAGTLAPFLWKTLIRTVGAAGFVCLLGVAFWRPLGTALYSDSSGFTLVAVTLAAILATVAFSVIQGILHGLRLFRVTSFVELFHDSGFLLLTLVFLFVWRNDVFSAAYAHLAITILVTMAIGCWTFHAIKSSKPAAIIDSQSTTVKFAWWSLVAFSLGTWSAGSLQAVWRCLDRYMLLHLGNMSSDHALDQIGQYFIASKLAQPLSALVGLLSVVLLPHAVRLWEDQQKSEVIGLVRLVAKVATLGMTFVGAVLVIFKPWLFTILAGHVPFFASAVFAPVIVTIIAVSFHYIVRTYLLCRERAWSISGVWLIALVMNVVLNLYLIPRYQLLGAAYATMISAAVAAIAVLIISARGGFGVDRGLCLMLLAPSLLLLPNSAMLAMLSALFGLVACTDWILSSHEKQSVNDWFNQKLDQYFAARKKTTASLVASRS